MTRFTRFFLPALFVLTLTGCTPEPEGEDDAAMALVRRVVKSKAENFVIEYITSDSSKDVFELESKNGRIILRGNNGVSIASALNYYLKHYCLKEVSWSNPTVDLVGDLPVIQTMVRKVSPYKYRYYLNYCTFNYTMAWWDLEQWQREIDWMALNGINMPLALTGEEAIWRDVYNELGFTDGELESFFTGPAYFSWLWMGNIDGWGGPLPKYWMASHKELQKKIVEKERSLGMQTVLPAFTGHVPPSFGKKFPDAKLKKTNWDAGFNDVYILDAEDSLFGRIGAMFLEAQTKAYGTDHLYSADTFNENVPPSSDSTFMSRITRKIFNTMTTTDPQAVWIMQGWMFHYNDEFWKPTQIKALTAAVPQDRLIILDLYSESHPVWKQTDAYYGQPWIWNMLQNFGGNVSMFGRMDAVAEGPAAALNNSLSGKMLGIGLTPEGSHQNPALFALMLENVWEDQPINTADWLNAYARRRYGADNASITKAWHILHNTVYNGGYGEGGPESILVARPTFDSVGHRVRTKLDYDPALLVEAWEMFIANATVFRESDGYQYDLVDITRQVLANYALSLQQKMAVDFRRRDGASLKQHGEEFITLIDDLDMLLNTQQDFLLGKWIHDARRWGKTDAEKDLYEFNARDLVTLWGDKDSELHEYSNRQWAGLMTGFYKPRWEQFIAYALQCIDDRRKPDFKSFEEKIKAWEWAWVKSTEGEYAEAPKGNAIDAAVNIYQKYKDKIKAAYE